MMKKLTVIALISLFAMINVLGVSGRSKAAGAEAGGAATAIATFKDVPNAHWAKAAIADAVRAGIVTGYPDGTFRPSKTITRAEVASMLSRVTKLTPNSDSSAFADLEKHWSKDAVRKLVALGFIKPSDYSKGFDPDKAITRYELMKWMASGLSASEPSFKQALADTKDTLLPTPESFKGEISAAQVPYIALVRGTGIITGFTDGTLKPADPTTRAEVVSMMLRYAVVEGTKADFYSDLNEMRAVGVEKTNIELVSEYKFDGENYKFTNVVGKTLSYRDLDVVIHRMIAVDLTTDAQKGLYAPLFVGKDRKPYQKGFYYVFFESTITMKTDKFDYLKLAGEITANNNIYGFTRVDDDVSKRLGLKVVPGDDPEKYMTKGTPRRIWSFNGIPPKDGGRMIIIDDSTIFSIFGGY